MPNPTLDKNVGARDRMARITIGLGLVLVAALAIPSSGLAALVGALGGLLIHTGWVGY